MNKLRFETVQDAAEYALKMFEINTGHKKIPRFKLNALIMEDSVYKAVSDAMRSIDLDVDSVFEYSVRAFGHIVEDGLDQFNSDYTIGTVLLNNTVSQWAENDADIYTSDLTEWLNKSVVNVNYLDDVLRETIKLTGWKAVQLAQIKARIEVYTKVIKALFEFVNSD